MRVAICLSGELRNYKDTFPYFKKYIMDVLNPDIFIYTNGNEDFLNNYNAKSISIQEGSVDLNHGYRQVHDSTSVISVLNQQHKIESCNKLKIEYENEHDFKYDIVIRCRLDSFFTRPFSSEELQPNKDVILVPWGWDFKGVSPYSETDIFALGDSETMNKYSSSYSNIPNYINQIVFHSETLIGYNLYKQGVKTKTYQINFIFSFPEHDINGNEHNVSDIMNGNGNHYTNKPYQGKNYFYPSSKYTK
tara:strand:- start:19 stop:762 length:744 start_codon:yes stop_codon:yes gene_type:complete